MSPTILKAAILIISDTAFLDPLTDTTGDILRDVFHIDGRGQWEVVETKIVPDNIGQIQRAVTQWTDQLDVAVNLVVTSGGTGFAVKDKTPEAITPLLHKQASGLTHGMLAASLTVTPFALMARPVAGVRNKTLIITLPGSPKGAKENLLAVLALLPHACLQAAGADSRSLHAGGVKKLEQDAGIAKSAAASAGSGQAHYHHSHDHSHNHQHSHGGHSAPVAHTTRLLHPRSNDPKEGPSRRYRSSPYPMLSVDEATALIAANTPAPRTVKTRVSENLVGCTLAEAVVAPESVPAFRASIVDGYAVIVSWDGPSTKGVFPVVSVSNARPGETPPLQPGQIARITTGAPLPKGATSVVMVEDTVLTSTTETNEEKEVEILTDKVKPGENVREIGSDIQSGEIILRKGDEITAVGGELGLLASVGILEAVVYERPIVGVLSTGDEIVPHDKTGELRLGEVRDCNRPTILAALKGWGFETIDLGIASDTSNALEEALRAAFLRVDVIVTTGGVSMGELDLLKPTIEHGLGGIIHFGRVNMRPGKPTTFATVPHKDSATGNWTSKLVFSLPGNPASAITTLHLFVLPALRRAANIEPASLPRARVVLDHDILPDPQRPEYHRALAAFHSDGSIRARSTGGQRSSRVGSLKGANALLCLPASPDICGKGSIVDALLIGRVERSLEQRSPYGAEV
ncbi:hypothetical protein FGG08_003556 [Glutinoglossum americanum]|uniref:MoaB/Mog domain-containing protein n=1 Tax=Glutinoglossum americanum TaxID=1670608 RepID=A0A9P8HY27_9PEZI|nr:hypothetical protein FGG08_003556 [Glutinoglossum americanum]